MHDIPLKSRPTPLQITLVALCAALAYYLVRLPLSPLTLAYYDDGENLYHTLAILSGKIPYRDDYNHHFAGYLLPLILMGKLFGVIPNLFQITYPVVQGITGALIFCIASRWCSLRAATLVALVGITAREPWILGHYIQTSLNPLWLGVLLCSLRITELKRGELIAGALAGVAFICDQRALFFSLIPITAIVVAHNATGTFQIFKRAMCYSFGALIPCLGALFYLWHNGALISFYEQTRVFPSTYRSASLSLLETISLALANHRYLFTESPLLALAALAGIVVALRHHEHKAHRIILLSSALALSMFIACGGRDFDYYSIVWIPLLALFAAITYQRCSTPKLRAVWYCLLGAQCILAPLGSISMLNDQSLQSYRGDGVREVADYLREHKKPHESLYLLGYRLDLYVYLGEVSSYPFSSQIFYLPDPEVPESAHHQHMYPKYYEHFKESLTNTPPDWIATFTTSILDRSPARTAEQFVHEMIKQRYQQQFTNTQKNFRGDTITFTVFKKVY